MRYLRDLQRAVYDHLVDHDDGWRAIDIAEALGWGSSWAEITSALLVLQEAGLVEMWGLAACAPHEVLWAIPLEHRLGDVGWPEDRAGLRELDALPEPSEEYLAVRHKEGA